MTVPVTDLSVPRKVSLTTPQDEVIRLIKQDGFVIIQGFLDLDTVQRLGDEVDATVKERATGSESEVHKNRVGKENKHISNLSIRSATFRDDILNHKWMHDICKQTFTLEFGNYWLNRAHIVQVESGEKAEVFHRDAGVYRVNEFRRKSDDPEFMLNFLVSLTELREDNGAIRVIPGSHTWGAKHPPTLQSCDEAVPIVLKPGDALMYFGTLFHGLGENHSSHPARGMIVSIHPSAFTPTESHFHLPKDLVETMTPLAQQMIGWRTMQVQNLIPIWQAGDENIEDVIGLKYKENS